MPPTASHNAIHSHHQALRRWCRVHVPCHPTAQRGQQRGVTCTRSALLALLVSQSKLHSILTRGGAPSARAGQRSRHRSYRCHGPAGKVCTRRHWALPHVHGVPSLTQNTDTRVVRWLPLAMPRRMYRPAGGARRLLNGPLPRLALNGCRRRCLRPSRAGV